MMGPLRLLPIKNVPGLLVLLVLIGCALAQLQPPRSTPQNCGLEAPTGTVAGCSTATVPEERALPIPEAPRFEPHECWMDAPKGMLVDCGTVTVPENRALPLTEDNRIRLAIAVVHTSAAQPGPAPVFMLAGEPGESAIDTIENPSSLWLAILSQCDLVLIDQRGTGFSDPNLDCLQEDLAACHRRLVGQGIDLSAYTTTNNAADINDIRLALGYDQVNLLAGSYGTHLALSILRDFPKGIRSAVLDGVVPPQIHLDPEMMRAFARSLQSLFTSCAASPACSAAYPRLEETFNELVPYLEQQPIRVHAGEGEHTIDGQGFVDLLFEALHHSELLPYLPCLIACTFHGDHRVIEGIVQAFAGIPGTQTQPRLPDHISEGMQYSVLCAEEVAYETEAEFQAAAREFDPAVREFVLHSFRYFTRVCEDWPVPRGLAVEEQPAVSDVPVLLLAGEFDPSTPLPFAQAAAPTLSHHYLYEIPATGHVTWRTSDCAVSLISQFLSDPTSEPDTSCLAQIGPVEFVTEE